MLHYFYQKSFLPEFVCMHTDRAAMQVGLEVPGRAAVGHEHGPQGGIELTTAVRAHHGNAQPLLEDAGGVVARAAERLRIRRTTLVEKMRKYGMNRRDDDMGD